MGTHHTLHRILEILVMSIEMIGVVVMLWGVALFLKDFLQYTFKKSHHLAAWQKAQRVRAQLGTYILIALELLIVADIIETVSNRSLENLAMLASIVLIRTAISYFLEKEITGAEQYIERSRASGGAHEGE